jgi:hypothetical protein
MVDCLARLTHPAAAAHVPVQLRATVAEIVAEMAERKRREAMLAKVLATAGPKRRMVHAFRSVVGPFLGITNWSADSLTVAVRDATAAAHQKAADGTYGVASRPQRFRAAPDHVRRWGVHPPSERRRIGRRRRRPAGPSGGERLHGGPPV